MTLIPVLVRVDGERVAICELGYDGDGDIGIPQVSFFEDLGTVKKGIAMVMVDGTKKPRTVWRWSSEGYSGSEPTKSAAVAAMLHDAGYTEVEETATIPPLFDIEETV
jgi:hypothetical protein